LGQPLNFWNRHAEKSSGGDEDVLRWDGVEWAIVPFLDITLPNPTLNDIHAVSENDV